MQTGVIGNSVEDEENYLENVFTAPTYKLSYVNLNGAPVSEVLFWDVLAQMEAMRYYYKQIGDKEIAQPQLVHGPREEETIAYKPAPLFGNESITEIILRKIKTRKWKTSFYPLASMFVQRKIVPSRFAAKIPRPLLYPAIKLLLLIEYYVVLLYKRKDAFSYYRFISPKQKVQRVGEDYRVEILNGKATPTRKVISLRNLVIENRKTPTNITEASKLELLNGL